MTAVEILRANGWRMGHWATSGEDNYGLEYWEHHDRYPLVRYTLGVALADELERQSARLGEATALLEQVSIGYAETGSNSRMHVIVKAFLSRAPAQAARQQALQVQADCERGLAQDRAQAAEPSGEDGAAVLARSTLESYRLSNARPGTLTNNAGVRAESTLAAVNGILDKHWRRKLTTQKEINHAAIDVAVRIDNLLTPEPRPAPEPHYAEQFGINPAPGYVAPEPTLVERIEAEAFALDTPEGTYNPSARLQRIRDLIRAERGGGGT